MQVAINELRASRLFDLVVWLQEGLYPYGHLEKAQLPHREENLPKTMPRGGKEHALFLFFCCLWMKGPIQSDTAIRSLAKIYDSQPRLFDPAYAMALEPAEIEAILLSFGLTMRKWNSIYWVEDARILEELWQGDPRNLYQGLEGKDPDVIWSILLERIQRDHRRKKGFLGFQEKMVSMITYYLMETGLIPHFLFPTPIDFHAIRMAIMLGIVEVDSELGSNSAYVEAVRGKVREFLFSYSKEHNIDPLQLCDAIWMYSRSMCSDSPSSLSRLIKEDANGVELRGRSRVVISVEPDWNNRTHLRNYAKSCGMCPLEPDCRLVLRAPHYYVRGLVLPEPRLKPPVEQLSIVSLQVEALLPSEGAA